MARKLLQKTRNKFLYRMFPENLIPNRRLVKSKKFRFNRRILSNQHPSLGKFLKYNQDVQGKTQFSPLFVGAKNQGIVVNKKKGVLFSVPQIKHVSPEINKVSLCLPPVSKGSQEINLKNAPKEILFNFTDPFFAPQKTGLAELVRWNTFGVKKVPSLWKELAGYKAKKKTIWDNGDIIHPADHIMINKINRFFGGNIVQYLKSSTNFHQMERAGQQASVVTERAAEFSANFLSLRKKAFSFIPKNPTVTKPVQSKTLTLSIGSPGKHEKFVPFQSCASLMQSVGQGIHWQSQCMRFIPFFCIDPHKKFFSIASLMYFLKNQVFKKNWDSLFSIHDINRKRDKIKDQYRNQYTEYKKIAILYGNLPKRALIRAMRCTKKERGELELKFFSVLESRLDVVLKRVLFFPTIYSARQWVNQGKILINNQVCTCNNYLLQPGDFVSIRKESISAWRKGWFKHFRSITKSFSAARLSNAPLNATLEESVPGVNMLNVKRNACGYKKRRFLFSPSLMLKWKNWSKLWGNRLICNVNITPLSPQKTETKSTFGGKGGKNQRCTKWSNVFSGLENPFSKRVMSGSQQSGYTPNVSMPGYSLENFGAAQVKARSGGSYPIFNCFTPSVLVNYFSSLGALAYKCKLSWSKKADKRIKRITTTKRNSISINRFSTPILYWLKNLNRKFSGVFPGKGRFIKRGFSVALEKGYSFGLRNIRANLLLFAEKLLFGSLLLQQQTRVVDGCLEHRWNKVFAKKKPIGLKKRSWQWSCIKPMHLECSYKHCTVVYLYTPQKFVWPSTLNVLLLKRALNC